MLTVFRKKRQRHRTRKIVGKKRQCSARAVSIVHTIRASSKLAWQPAYRIEYDTVALVKNIVEGISFVFVSSVYFFYFQKKTEHPTAVKLVTLKINSRNRNCKRSHPGVCVREVYPIVRGCVTTTVNEDESMPRKAWMFSNKIWMKKYSCFFLLTPKSRILPAPVDGSASRRVRTGLGGTRSSRPGPLDSPWRFYHTRSCPCFSVSFFFL